MHKYLVCYISGPGALSLPPPAVDGKQRKIRERRKVKGNKMAKKF